MAPPPPVIKAVFAMACPLESDNVIINHILGI
jgi:hypothetical protein